MLADSAMHHDGNRPASVRQRMRRQDFNAAAFTVHPVQDNPSFGWPSPDALLLRPLWLAAAGGVMCAAARLPRLFPRRFAAPLLPAVQRFKHSRKRAGLVANDDWTTVAYENI